MVWVLAGGEVALVVGKGEVWGYGGGLGESGIFLEKGLGIVLGIYSGMVLDVVLWQDCLTTLDQASAEL